VLPPALYFPLTHTAFSSSARNQPKSDTDADTCSLLREKSQRCSQPVEETLLNGGAAETGCIRPSQNDAAVCRFPSTTRAVPSIKQKKRIQRLL